MLDINFYHVATISLMIWLLMVLLNRFFFKPVGEVINTRESQEAQEKAQLKDYVAQIDTLTSTANQQLNSARLDARTLQERLIAEGASKRDQLIEETRLQIRNQLDLEMVSLQDQIDTARSVLLSDIGQFSAGIRRLFQ